MDIISKYKTQPQAEVSSCFQIQLATPEAFGDIVDFYNNIFVPVMEAVVRGLAGGSSLPDISSSPLPEPRSKKRTHSPRKVARNTSLTVSVMPLTPVNEPRSDDEPSMSYAFHLSPSKSLTDINRKMRKKPSKRSIEATPESRYQPRAGQQLVFRGTGDTAAKGKRRRISMTALEVNLSSAPQ